MLFILFKLIDLTKTGAVDNYLEIVIFLVNNPEWEQLDGFAGAKLAKTQHGRDDCAPESFWRL
jgi:hypothetical protein